MSNVEEEKFEMELEAALNKRSSGMSNEEILSGSALNEEDKQELKEILLLSRKFQSRDLPKPDSRALRAVLKQLEFQNQSSRALHIPILRHWKKIAKLAVFPTLAMAIILFVAVKEKLWQTEDAKAVYIEQMNNDITQNNEEELTATDMDHNAELISSYKDLDSDFSEIVNN